MSRPCSSCKMGPRRKTQAARFRDKAALPSVAGGGIVHRNVAEAFTEEQVNDTSTSRGRLRDRRVFLAIGNSYSDTKYPLSTPPKAAEAIARLLREWGDFEGEASANLTRLEMEHRLSSCSHRSFCALPRPTPVGWSTWFVTTNEPRRPWESSRTRLSSGPS